MSRFFRVKIGRNTKPPTEPAISSSELKQSREMIDLPSRSIHSFFARKKKRREERGEGKKNSVNRSRCSASNVLADSLIDSRSVLKRSTVNFDVSSVAFGVILGENGSELIHIIFFVNGAKNDWYCMMKNERNFLMYSGIIKNRNITSRKVFMLL